MRTLETDLGPLLPEAGFEFLLGMFVLYGLMIGAVVAVGVLFYRASRKRRGRAELTAGGPLPLAQQLTEIDGLLAEGRITDDEHAAMRSQILNLR